MCVTFFICASFFPSYCIFYTFACELCKKVFLRFSERKNFDMLEKSKIGEFFLLFLAWCTSTIPKNPTPHTWPDLHTGPLSLVTGNILFSYKAQREAMLKWFSFNPYNFWYFKFFLLHIRCKLFSIMQSRLIIID